MLKQFIACANKLERYEFFKGTVTGDWNEQELEAVGDILGLNVRNEGNKMNKYVAVRKELENRVSSAA